MHIQDLDSVSWVSILPPLVAILLAVAFRQVVVALFVGIWLGALFLVDYNPGLAFIQIIDTYVVDALVDRGHASVIVFSMMLGGMVGVISRAGGAVGLARAVLPFATTGRRVQLSSWALGLFVFFDDFANTLLVGPTMRPISDKLKISREKLAFIVDATAAPVVSLAIISSWIGMEIGLIADQYRDLGLSTDAYIVFLQTLPYRFYPWLMLFFGFMIAISQRDFGPMLRAEQRAWRHGKLLADGARPAASFEDPAIAPIPEKPARWINAVIPIVSVIVTIVVAMWLDGTLKVLNHNLALDGRNLALGLLLPVDGFLQLDNQVLEASARNIFSQADSYKALLWASLIGCVMAILLAVGQGILKLSQALEAWLVGLKSMVLAMVILILAWSLGAVCKELETARFLIGVLGDWLTPALLPALVFVVSGMVSFATGTSWGTMGILFPLVVPLTHAMAPADQVLMLGTISSILAGSVWGDHCSPISDTTIMSSMATSCDHIDHVRTQLPYALVVGLVSLLLGDLACGFGWWSPWMGLLLGMGALSAILWYWGQRVDFLTTG